MTTPHPCTWSSIPLTAPPPFTNIIVMAQSIKSQRFHTFHSHSPLSLNPQVLNPPANPPFTNIILYIFLNILYIPIYSPYNISYIIFTRILHVTQPSSAQSTCLLKTSKSDLTSRIKKNLHFTQPSSAQSCPPITSKPDFNIFLKGPLDLLKSKLDSWLREGFKKPCHGQKSE